MVLTLHSQSGRRTSLAGRTLLAHPDLIFRAHASLDSLTWANSPQEQSSFSGSGHNLVPSHRSLKPPCLGHGWDVKSLSWLSPVVIYTITQVKTSSMRQPSGIFLPHHHAFRKHTCFLVPQRGDEIKSSKAMPYPSWELSLVLKVLQRALFEPLESAVLISIKRVGDLQVLSVSEECLELGPKYSYVVLNPRPAMCPMIPPF